MPYIKKEDRARLIADVNCLLDKIKTPGELNYVLSTLCNGWLHWRGARYEQHAEVMGALECVKQEFYRKVTAPYENQKCSENGEVY